MFARLVSRQRAFSLTLGRGYEKTKVAVPELSDTLMNC